jgi:fatty acid desaturase
VKHTLVILSLAIGLAAVALLAVFGFAVWVFIPLLPAGIIFVIILVSKRGVVAAERPTESDTNSRKAA